MKYSYVIQKTKIRIPHDAHKESQKDKHILFPHFICIFPIQNDIKNIHTNQNPINTNLIII